MLRKSKILIEVKKELEAQGFYTLIQHGGELFDVIGIDRGRVVGVVCKNLSEEEWMQVRLIANNTGIIPLFSYFEYGKVKYVDLETGAEFDTLRWLKPVEVEEC